MTNGQGPDEIRFWIEGEKGRMVDPKLFSVIAENLARKLANEWTASGKKKNRRTQLRKFYDEILRLEATANLGSVDWDHVLPQIHMLAAKVAYAEGRELITSTFRKFIKESIKQVEDENDLHVFSAVFEAMMGFYRLYGPNN